MTAPPSMEVVGEQWYDACAWLRDLETPMPPEGFTGLTLNLQFPLQCELMNTETGERYWDTVLVPVTVTRYVDGSMTLEAPTLTARIDLDVLKEKRP